ncbi:hypothetical protein BDB01DRAFT_784879 [Pilobolus umbonatus]|nr:hypothetical protein BDB01DRAFT_784879 [Pilobolus umbonatus]
MYRGSNTVMYEFIHISIFICVGNTHIFNLIVIIVSFCYLLTVCYMYNQCKEQSK